MNRRGFSMVEILVVLSILNLLGAIGLPRLIAARSLARNTAAKVCAIGMYRGQADYYNSNSAYASNLTTLGTSRYQSGCKGLETADAPTSAPFKHLAKGANQIYEVSPSGIQLYTPLVPTGTFDTNLSGWNARSAETTLTRTTSLTRSGSGAAQLDVVAGNRGTGVENYGSTSPVRSGVRYIVSAWFYIPTTSTFTGTWVMWVQAYNPATGCAGNCQRYIPLSADQYIPATSPKGVWFQKTLDFRTNSSSNPADQNLQLQVMLITDTVDASGRILMDDVRMEVQDGFTTN